MKPSDHKLSESFVASAALLRGAQLHAALAQATSVSPSHSIKTRIAVSASKIIALAQATHASVQVSEDLATGHTVLRGEASEIQKLLAEAMQKPSPHTTASEVSPKNTQHAESHEVENFHPRPQQAENASARHGAGISWFA